MVYMTQEAAILLKVWFFVSPFIILYLYRKLKYSTPTMKIKAVPELQELMDSLNADLDAYITLIQTYGSIQGYEDARMKDFEIMRGYLKTVSNCMQSSIKNLSVFLEEIDRIDGRSLRKITKDYTSFVIDDFVKCVENLNHFIESEEQAHTQAHSTQEILEERRKKDGQKR